VHYKKEITMKPAIMILVTVPILGCANSGVVPTGPDAYMIAKSEWGFTSGAVHKARLLQEASEYCKSIGKQMLATSTSHNDVALGKTPAAEVQFKCVTTGTNEQPQSSATKQ